LLLEDRYELLEVGTSVGRRYGPRLVARTQMRIEDLKGRHVALPGRRTTATLIARGLLPPFEEVHMDFTAIMDAVRDGEVDAGVIIHEGQLTYEQEGLVEIINMGKWWKERTGLPLPLGVNVVRKDLGPELCREVSRCMRESIEAGLSNRKEALAYALQFARGLDESTSDEFVGMYVNDRTRDMGPEGIAAIRRMLSEAAEIGLVPKVDVEVID
ncbi:MAG: ABC transporter substrate-binding protein, partial [Armatimonadetes bacterium]